MILPEHPCTWQKTGVLEAYTTTCPMCLYLHSSEMRVYVEPSMCCLVAMRASTFSFPTFPKGQILRY